MVFHYDPNKFANVGTLQRDGQQQREESESVAVQTVIGVVPPLHKDGASPSPEQHGQGPRRTTGRHARHEPHEGSGSETNDNVDGVSEAMRTRREENLQEVLRALAVDNQPTAQQQAGTPNARRVSKDTTEMPITYRRTQPEEGNQSAAGMTPGISNSTITTSATSVEHEETGKKRSFSSALSLASVVLVAGGALVWTGGAGTSGDNELLARPEASSPLSPNTTGPNSDAMVDGGASAGPIGSSGDLGLGGVFGTSPSQTPVAPTEFVIPTAVSAGNTEGCLEVARPTLYSTVFMAGKDATNSPSFAKATVEGKDYWVRIPQGGVGFVLQTCGLMNLPVSSEKGKISTTNVVQQHATVNTANMVGSGQQSNDESMKMISRGQFYSDVKGAPSEDTCKVLTNGENPDCDTITSLTTDQQQEVLDSLSYITAAAVEGTCADSATKSAKSAVRQVIKSEATKQNVDAFNVTVSFSDTDVSYLTSEMTKAPGVKTPAERLAMFPDIKAGNLVVNCNVTRS